MYQITEPSGVVNSFYFNSDETYNLNPNGNTAYGDAYTGGFIRNTQNGTTSANYPIFDAHGNIISTLSRQGNGNYSTSSSRTFDAWGQIRIGSQTGDPKGGYCASLGHKQDDESGLVYMRARFYEPASGRFLSEDSERNGLCWFSYAGNNPISNADKDGHSAVPDFLIGIFLMVLGLILFTGGENAGSELSSLVAKIKEGQLAAMLRVTGIAEETLEKWDQDLLKLIQANKANTNWGTTGKAAGGALMAGGAAKAVLAIFGYNLICQSLLIDINLTDGPDVVGTLFG